MDTNDWCITILTILLILEGQLFVSHQQNHMNKLLVRKHPKRHSFNGVVWIGLSDHAQNYFYVA